MSWDTIALERAIRAQAEKEGDTLLCSMSSQEMQDMLREILMDKLIAEDKEREKRRRLFDPGNFKHIGWCLCEGQDFISDMTTPEGVMAFLDQCFLASLEMYYHEDQIHLSVFFVEANEFGILTAIDIRRREATGLVKEEYYCWLKPSEHILKDIDDLVETTLQKHRDLRRKQGQLLQ